MVILQLAVLFLFLAIGELVVWLTDIPIPSSIIGMLLLTLSLQLKIIKLRHVAGVALLEYFDLIKGQWMAIVGASTISTLIVIGVTGWVHQIVRRHYPHTRNALSRK